MESVVRSLDELSLQEGRCVKFTPITQLPILNQPSQGSEVSKSHKVNGFEEAPKDSQDWNVVWIGGHAKTELLTSLNPFQRVNHFPRTIELTRKDRLLKNIRRMRDMHGAKNFDFVPRAFSLPIEYEDFKADFTKTKNKLGLANTWIVKPINLSRGRGIRVTNSMDEIAGSEQAVVQRYIANPLTINGLKFDLRIYAVVTSFCPLRIYFYHEGLARFATEKYDTNLEGLSNPFIHLTNYSINRNSENFVKNTSAEQTSTGNKWSLSALLAFLKEQGRDTNQLLEQIHDIIIKTMISVEPFVTSSVNMFVPYRGNCFELFGFDILIDSDMKPWLLEVNLSPSMNCDAPIDLKIKTQLMCDIYNMVRVELFDSESLPKSDSSDMIVRKSERPYQSLATTTVHEPTLIKETAEEYARRGNFIRIFPSSNFPKYEKYFGSSKHINSVMYEHLYNKS